MLATSPEELLRKGGSHKYSEKEGEGEENTEGYLDKWHLAHLLISRSYPDLDLPWRMNGAPSISEYLSRAQEADTRSEPAPMDTLGGVKSCLDRWEKSHPGTLEQEDQGGKAGYILALSSLIASLNGTA